MEDFSKVVEKPIALNLILENFCEGELTPEMVMMIEDVCYESYWNFQLKLKKLKRQNSLLIRSFQNSK